MEETAVPPEVIKLRLALLSALGTLALFVFTLSADAMRPFFLNVSYYLMWALVLAWGWALARFLRKNGFTAKQSWEKNRLGLCLTLALTAAIFLSVKPGWRVLSDDTNLLGISRSLVYEHQPLNPTMGYNYYGNFQIKRSELDKRPLLFPFLAHLLHLALGYSAINLFVLNFIAAWALLFLFYRVFEREAGPPGGMAASLLLASYPIFSLNATGGGFDLLSTLFIALSLLTVWIYMQKPETEELDLLWFTLLMLANIRYESIIYLPVIFLLLWSWRRIADKMRLVLLALWTAPLFLPTFWQRLLSMGQHEQPAGTSLFRFDSLVANLREMLAGQLDFTLPYNNLANVAAFICFEWLMVVLLRRRREDEDRLVFSTVAVAVVGLGLVISCAHFFVPTYSHATGARLFLAFSAFCAFLTALFLLRVIRIPAWGALGLALVLFGVYHPIAMERRFTNNLILVRTTDEVYNYLNTYADKHTLLVIDRPGQYAVLERGAVNFKYANSNAIDILNSARRKLFSEILVAQEILYKTGLPKLEHKLDAAYKLETIYELQNSGDTFLRISRVTEDSLPPSGYAAL